MEEMIAIGFIALYISMIAGFYLWYSSLIRKALGMEEEFAAPPILRLATVALAVVSPSILMWLLSLLIWVITWVLRLAT